MEAYKHFGVMLDCSRNAVMKPEAVKRMIDCLEKMGYNTLELYTEDTYEVGGRALFRVSPRPIYGSGAERFRQIRESARD